MASISRAPGKLVDQRSPLRRFDWLLLASATVLLGIGLLSLLSISAREHDSFFKKQVAMLVIGLGPFALFFFTPPDIWKRISTGLYVLNLVMLAAVLRFGSSANGAQRWIDLKVMQFQPSELAKMLIVLTLAAFFASRHASTDKLSTFALSFLHVAVPALLIAKQPHYGGAMVLIVIWLAISIGAGVPLKFILAAVLLLGVGAVAAVKIPGVLHGYHMKRLRAMKSNDRDGASYQQDRAQIALAVGGAFGTGFMKGTQRLPEQQNDFILTVPGEEFGLFGCFVILGAYGFFFYRIWVTMLRAAEPYHRMIASGIMALLAFHTVVNIGMVIGALPVVGLWLPFMSAGGSSLWLCMACVGLLLNLRTREKPLLF